MALAVRSPLWPALLTLALGVGMPLAFLAGRQFTLAALMNPTIESTERFVREVEARPLATPEHVASSGEPPSTAPTESTAPSPQHPTFSPPEVTKANLPPAPKPPPPPPIPCGTITCAPSNLCCSPTCGICAASADECIRQGCGLASWPGSEQCGPNTCNVGDVCCNVSCGICLPPGVSCSQTKCETGLTFSPFSQPCGMNTCNVGLVCCDARCGLCAPVEECARLHC